MKKGKKVTIVILAIIGVIFSCGFSSCSNASARRDKEYSEEVKEQIADSIGYPDLANFFEYAQLKEIYELRDDPKLIWALR